MRLHIVNGQMFLSIIKQTLTSFFERHGFTEIKSTVSGRLYSTSFRSKNHEVVISFEPGDEALFVFIFGVDEEGQKTDIDDRSKTPRLTDLNNRYMGLADQKSRDAVELEFMEFQGSDKAEKLLIKTARDLRLVLPLYLNEVHR